MVWAANGVPVCTAQFDQSELRTVPDGNSVGIFAWTDRRQSTETDVYAMRIDAGGGTPSGVSDPLGATAVLVHPPWPNPFAESTGIELQLNDPTAVSIDVTDAFGRRVRRLTPGDPLSGLRGVNFDGRDDSGRSLAKGVYFLRVEVNGSTSTQKLVKVR
jgi:hypothetical protein